MLVVHLHGLVASYLLVQYLHVMAVVRHCQAAPVLFLL